MGRAIKNPPAAAASSKLVATGEYVLTQVSGMGDQANYTIWTYNYPKQKSATETYLYMSAQFSALEAYSYAPAPCIRCANQTANGYNGSQYFFGYTSSGGGEAEYNIYSCQNFAHSEALDGFSANISGSNFGVGTVPIIIRWETNDGSGNRPGHIFCPNEDSGNYDTRGSTHWYGYLRVWEIAY